MAMKTKFQDELLLELVDLCIVESHGERMAQAAARLTFNPADNEKPGVSSGLSRFISPLDPGVSEELQWYLERYYQWPTGVFKERASKIEAMLPKWGNTLFNNIFHGDSSQCVLNAWETSVGDAPICFTISVNPLQGKQKTGEQIEAKEAAALLTVLPWELLHDGKRYLFQGAKPVSVRRQLQGKYTPEQPDSPLPLRILLVSPRPEDKIAGYFDHRVSALPLVDSLEKSVNLTDVKILSPPTFQALEAELARAHEREKPYHVVHFDGTSADFEDLGMWGLVFEEPGDMENFEKRQSRLVSLKALAEVVGRGRSRLFILDAGAAVSTAATLQYEGVGAVVAMSHSLSIPAKKVFYRSFYSSLINGASVGQAMLAGRRGLYADSDRQVMPGEEEMHLQDWFVPVLFQQCDDLIPVVKRKPERASKRKRKESAAPMGALPEPPQHGFIGRGRELLKLERLLELNNYVVIHGQGGEGKTTLAVELARWLVRSQRFKQAVFVSLDDCFDLRMAADRIGRQLSPGFTVSRYPEGEWLDETLKLFRREMRRKRSIIVLDNIESILFAGVNVSRFEPEVLNAFFDFCKRLLRVKGTRIIFLSRETLPGPFDIEEQHVKLGRLDMHDAMDLVYRAMTLSGLSPGEEESPEARQDVERLVETVNCHARSLVLLGLYIKRSGRNYVSENLGQLMSDLHQKYGNDQELSLYASLEISLRQFPMEMRQKIVGLGVFQGGGHIVTVGQVLELQDDKRDELIHLLIHIGLVELMPYNFVQFHPALSPYLLGQLQENKSELEKYKSRWVESIMQLSLFLYERKFKDAQLSSNLTTLELPNLLALLDHYNEQDDPEATLSLATRLEQLIVPLGRRSLLNKVAAIREKTAGQLPDFSHSSFEAAGMKIERLLQDGDINSALRETRDLVDKCAAAGEDAYPGILYDTAMAFFLLSRVLFAGGDINSASIQVEEALKRFRLLADRGNAEAERMAVAALTQKADGLTAMGRLEEAASLYREGIRLSSKLRDLRGVAVKKGQLGTVLMYQRRYDDAQMAYREALDTFEKLGEPSAVATVWHQLGMLNYEAGRFEESERAYRKSLAISVRQNDIAGEAGTLNQLGNLYNQMGQTENAVLFLRRAIEKNIETRDMAKEGLNRTNLAILLIQLARFDEARMEIEKAIRCKTSFGHAAEPWKTWHILSDLEQTAGNREAAAAARNKALNMFMAYRKDGGENYEPGGRLVRDFLHAIQEDNIKSIETLLDKLANHPDVPKSIEILVTKLQAILNGSRDPALAEDPDLDYKDSVEIKLLLEALENSAA